MNTKKKTDERVRRLVVTIGKGASSRKELIAALGLRQESRRNFYYNYLNPARELGLVQMLYPERPSLPEQSYQLTRKGLEWLEKFFRRMTSAGYKWSIMPPAPIVDTVSINKTEYHQSILSSGISYRKTSMQEKMELAAIK